MRFHFSLAEEKDEPDLRHLLASSLMEGKITTAFQREPNYFLGCSPMGHDCKVMIARAAETGELAMIGCTVVLDRFVNGERCRVGYFGQLRVAESYQGLMLPARGMAFLREVHAHTRADLWLTAIADQNVAARNIFVLPPATMFPHLRPAASIQTLGILLGRGVKKKAAAGPVEKGSPETVKEIVHFLNHEGGKKQFYPCYTEDNFLRGELTRGFELEDFRVVRRKGNIIGAAGLWDQSAYKQTIVHGYHGFLKTVKPLYNAAAPLLRIPSLPEKGQKLNAAYLAFICVEDNDPRVFSQLLEEQCRAAQERGFHYLMVGLTGDDPLLRAAEVRRHIRYTSTLFSFSMKTARSQLPVLDGRISYIEIAGL